MINLKKLDKEIDQLFKNETEDSLTNWLLNKRFGNIYKIIGKGTFVNLSRQSKAIFISKSSASFNNNMKNANSSPDNPINRRAA